MPAPAEPNRSLAAPAQTELLRFTTAGSVDDGKSTLIGRLLYDSKGVYEDQLASVRKATRNHSTGGLDLSLLTDGLRAEREQGITIDVAYRYFSTPRRKFIIADTPGHEQYTRNMATGASTANLAIILIDARNGVLPQSRRHAYHRHAAGHSASCGRGQQDGPGGFPRGGLRRPSADEFAAFAAQLGVRDLTSSPSARCDGDNVVQPQPPHALVRRPQPARAPGNRAHRAATATCTDLRFPVQYVIRPNLDFRGFAGQLASGVIRPRRRRSRCCPRAARSRVKSIVTWEGELEEAFAPMSVTVCLEDEIDISRGDMLVRFTGSLPHAARRFEATGGVDEREAARAPAALPAEAHHADRAGARHAQCATA